MRVRRIQDCKLSYDNNHQYYGSDKLYQSPINKRSLCIKLDFGIIYIF